uniref:LppX_LprAFG lipoprotein n=1 Tax=Herbidospora sakaeratensis TaxID=564415 RepID=UPI0007842AF5|nr:LppX_LprAFG lipoprotein [Herbidospora sakaeratensis]
MRRILCLAALVAFVTACSSATTEGGLPAAPDVLKKSAAAMGAVKTVAFSLTTEGNPPIPVKTAEGDLTREGDAKGKLQIMIGALQELEFVLAGDAVYIKGPTGGFQKSMSRAQLAALYDPSAVVTAVPTLLSSAKGATIEGEQNGVYTVKVTLPGDPLKKIVPGVTGDQPGTLMIDKATSRVTAIDLPLNGGTVKVALTDYDAPVTIEAPAV